MLVFSSKKFSMMLSIQFNNDRNLFLSKFKEKNGVFLSESTLKVWLGEYEQKPNPSKKNMQFICNVFGCSIEDISDSVVDISTIESEIIEYCKMNKEYKEELIRKLKSI